VGIDPDEADLLILAAVEFGYSGDCTGGQGVISAEYERGHTVFKALDYGLGSASAGIGYFLEEAGVSATGILSFGDLDSDVAAIGNLVAESFEVGFKTCNANG
jgi:hypothetical protein